MGGAPGRCASLSRRMDRSCSRTTASAIPPPSSTSGSQAGGLRAVRISMLTRPARSSTKKNEAAGASERDLRASHACEALAGIGPIRELPEILEPSGFSVLVLQIVRMLPHVDDQDG